MFVTILLGLCCMLLFFFNACTLIKFFFGLYSSAWEKTLANVVGVSSVEGWRRDTKVYTPKIYYEYFVDGVKHTGNLTTFNLERCYRSRALAEESVRKKYPIGMFIYVFVNPRDPTSSVIKAGVSISGFVALVVGVVCMAIFICMLINSLR